jgi:flagellar motor switch protein FliN
MEEKDLQEETENTDSAGEISQTVETEKMELSAAETPDEMAAFKEAYLFDAPEPEKHSDPVKNIERLLDVEMNVTVRFGKTEIPLREAVNFGVGSMIELNRSVDEPVDLLVNNFLFARGEVVVIDGYYGVRVTEIGSPEERSHTLLSKANSQ